MTHKKIPVCFEKVFIKMNDEACLSMPWMKGFCLLPWLKGDLLLMSEIEKENEYGNYRKGDVLMATPYFDGKFSIAIENIRNGEKVIIDYLWFSRFIYNSDRTEIIGIVKKEIIPIESMPYIEGLREYLMSICGVSRYVDFFIKKAFELDVSNMR